jgi:AcrR family transcriptional regulator
MSVDADLGRRERKKLERRATILKCGAALFEQHGFDAVSAKSLAEAADVSLRTLYNFFPTKVDILVGVQAQVIEDRLVHALEELGDPPVSPAEGLYRLVEAHFRVYEALDRDLILRITLEGAVQGPLTGGGQDYARLDARSIARVRNLIQIYASRGRLGKDPDIDALARLIFSAANGEFFLWVADPEQAVEVPLGHIRTHIALALRTTTP